MKILCLYNNDCALEMFDWLKDQGHKVVLRSDRLDAKWCSKQDFQLTVSYTYQFILTEEILCSLHNNVVNLHNSLLPFNRGADPNIWSIINQTPRGVTLHFVDRELDKGYIIAQAFVNDGENETLSSSYYNLDRAAKQLFKDAFKWYKFWPQMKKIVVGKGCYHSLKNGKSVKSVIDTYEMTIKEFQQKVAAIEQGSHKL